MILVRALVVAAGGTIGVAARMLLGLVVPDAGGAPLGVLTANIAGAFLLGVLAARLPSGTMRLFLGTGVLGGFTTYSALAVGSVELWTHAPLLAVAYAAGSVVIGLAAVALGLRVARPRAEGER